MPRISAIQATVLWNNIMVATSAITRSLNTACALEVSSRPHAQKLVNCWRRVKWVVVRPGPDDSAARVVQARASDMKV